jgi:hypothetical protein
MRVALATVEKRYPSPWELYALILLIGAAVYIPLSYLLPWMPAIHSPLRYTGFACPLCGGTRAVTALFTGQFVLALRYNPLALVFLALLLWWAFTYLAMVVPFRRRVTLSGSRRERVAFWVLVVAALLANWAWVLYTGMYLQPLAL